MLRSVVSSGTALAELTALFLRLGVTAFGGPAAHLAMMRGEVVDRRRWLTDAEFLDLVAATNLIPGPNSTEMAIHIGYRRAGVPGLLIAGIAFILPASLLVFVIAWLYVRFGHLPEVAWLMYGIGPVIIAIVLDAIWKLGRSALRTILPALIAVGACALALAGQNEIGLLVGGAVVTVLMRLGLRRKFVGLATLALAALAPPVMAAVAAASSASVPVTLTRLTLFFLKVGSILFGSGYVLLAFLRADLTERWGWLTDQQLIDAITVGQITPGPVFTTATFIGYLLAGWAGALLATVGIFAPGFVFVWLTHPMLSRLRESRAASALLDGVVAASLGLMAAVTWHLARTAIFDLTTLIVAAASAVAMLALRPNPTWLILAGAVAGWMLRGAT